MFYKFDNKLYRLVLATQLDAYYPTSLLTRAPRVIDVEVGEPMDFKELPAPPPAEPMVEPVIVKVHKAIPVAKPLPPPPPPPPPQPLISKVKYVSTPSFGYEKMPEILMELQDLFQKDDGIPVHLKRGRRDRILYYLTLALTGLGTLYAFKCLFGMMYPPMLPCEEPPPPPPPPEEPCGEPEPNPSEQTETTEIKAEKTEEAK